MLTDRLLREPIAEQLLLGVGGGTESRVRRGINFVMPFEIPQRQDDAPPGLPFDIAVQAGSKAGALFQQILDLGPGVDDQLLPSRGAVLSLVSARA